MRPFAVRMKGLFTGVGAPLALAACSAASSVAVGPAQTAINDCSGQTATEVTLTVTPGGTGIALAATGTAGMDNAVNIYQTAPPNQGYRSAGGTFTESVYGKVDDTCLPAAFDLVEQASAGPAPTPHTQHVVVPALGYRAPAPDLRLGMPQLTLDGTGTILNCSPAPLTFTVTTTPQGSVQPGAAAQTTHLTIPPGQQGAYPISGARAVDQTAMAWYLIAISAAGVPACTTGTGVVHGSSTTLPATAKDTIP